MHKRSQTPTTFKFSTQPSKLEIYFLANKLILKRMVKKNILDMIKNSNLSSINIFLYPSMAANEIIYRWLKGENERVFFSFCWDHFLTSMCILCLLPYGTTLGLDTTITLVIRHLIHSNLNFKSCNFWHYNFNSLWLTQGIYWCVHKSYKY